jgi:hypothetical protein
MVIIMLMLELLQLFHACDRDILPMHPAPIIGVVFRAA